MIHNLFKTFIEKVFVPFLPIMDPSVRKQWNHFSNIINEELFNFTEAYQYVANLSHLIIPTLNPCNLDKGRNKQLINILKKQNPNETSLNTIFYPGRQRAKIAMKFKAEEDKPTFTYISRQSKQKIRKEESLITAPALKQTFEKLSKMYRENQEKIQKLNTGYTETTYNQHF